MGSMHTGLEEVRGGMHRLAEFYAQRAAGEAGLIVTGGVAPNRAGVTVWGGSRMSRTGHARAHKQVTRAVHQEGGKIVMQILHAGRYAYTPFCVAPSALKAPIARFKPRALTSPGGADHPSIREVCGARPRGWLRWGGGDGVGRVFDQRVHCGRDQPQNDAGAATSNAVVGSPSRSSLGCVKRSVKISL